MYARIILFIPPILVGLTTANPVKLEGHFTSAEVVYLSDYRSGLPEDVGGIAADYYSNINNSHNGQYPDSQSGLITNHYPNVPAWEGHTYNLKFSSTGVTFTGKINSDAENLDVGPYAGTGSHGCHNFHCYKDTNGVLYSKPDGFGHTSTCSKHYYCRPIR